MKNTRKIIIYLVGVSCVGKSTIGKLLADRIGFSFYDFDDEIEKYFGKPKEYILDDYMFPYDFREYTRIVLHDLFNKKENAIIAGSPSGLRDVYLREYKKSRKESGNIFISIHISDKPENILERITFYDKESNYRPPIVSVFSNSLLVLTKRYRIHDFHTIARSEHTYLFCS